MWTQLTYVHDTACEWSYHTQHVKAAYSSTQCKLIIRHLPYYIVWRYEELFFRIAINLGPPKMRQCSIDIAENTSTFLYILKWFINFQLPWHRATCYVHACDEYIPALTTCVHTLCAVHLWECTGSLMPCLNVHLLLPPFSLPPVCYPVDHSSVKLKLIPGVECSDYINANYITVSTCSIPLLESV